MTETIAKSLKKEIVIPEVFKSVLMVMLFSYLTFAAAMIKIYIPGTPVPFTMQTFVLFMAVYYLSARENGISQLIYVAAGMFGAPVFAAGLTGALILMGPTAGYLAGFIISGILMSHIMRKAGKLTYIKAALIFALGGFIILALGTLHLYFTYRMPLDKAITSGFLPFVAGDFIKILAAAGFYKLKKQ
jgi:biotin transport system substrate-specific component